VETIEGQKFANETISVEGKSFRNCVFQSCTLTFQGGEMPDMAQCELFDTAWDLKGAAVTTLNFLSWLHVQTGGREIVEPIIDGIKRGDRF